MKKEVKEWIEKVLSDILFVNWDRFVDIRWKNNRRLNVFGWIDREKDSYKDFVVLEFDLFTGEAYFIATSSKKYSKRIADILQSGHTDCQRVEDKFNVNNMIRLKETIGGN